MLLSKEKATPSKSDRREDSVLFSLKELRRLEDERVKAEADARQAKADAERRAKAEAEQRAREEETRRAREEEDRRKRAESEREDRLRLEEAERRARIEGELKLRQQQLFEKQRRQHVQGRRFGRAAWMAAGAVALLFVAAGGGLATWTSRQHQLEKKALEQEIARRNDEARAAQLAFDAKIRALEEKAHRYLGEAKTAKDQARILGDLQRQKQAIEAARPRPPRRPGPAMQPPVVPPKPTFRVPQKQEIDNDPVGGLPDVKSGAF